MKDTADKTGGGRATKSRTRGWLQYECWNTCCIIIILCTEAWVGERESEKGNMKRRSIGEGGRVRERNRLSMAFCSLLDTCLKWLLHSHVLSVCVIIME